MCEDESTEAVVASSGELVESDTQVTLVGHTKFDPTDVYIGRGRGGRAMMDVDVGERGWLGNPFTLEENTREQSIAKYEYLFRMRLERDAEFRDAVAELAGKRLGCWCRRLSSTAPACHGDVVAHYADELAQIRG